MKFNIEVYYYFIKPGLLNQQTYNFQHCKLITESKIAKTKQVAILRVWCKYLSSKHEEWNYRQSNDFPNFSYPHWLYSQSFKLHHNIKSNIAFTAVLKDRELTADSIRGPSEAWFLNECSVHILSRSFATYTLFYPSSGIRRCLSFVRSHDTRLVGRSSIRASDRNFFRGFTKTGNYDYASPESRWRNKKKGFTGNSIIVFGLTLSEDQNKKVLAGVWLSFVLNAGKDRNKRLRVSIPYWEILHNTYTIFWPPRRECDAPSEPSSRRPFTVTF